MPPDCNLIDPDPAIRKNGVNKLKSLVDINLEIDSKLLGGVIYAAWGYISGNRGPKTNGNGPLKGCGRPANMLKKPGMLSWPSNR